MKLVEQQTVLLPDNCRIKAFWIVNGNGARVAKVNGDLNTESYGSIRSRAVANQLRLRYTPPAGA